MESTHISDSFAGITMNVKRTQLNANLHHVGMRKRRVGSTRWPQSGPDVFTRMSETSTSPRKLCVSQNVAKLASPT